MITVKIKYADFLQITRGRSLATATDDVVIIRDTAVDILGSSGGEHLAMRFLIGIPQPR